MTCGIAWNSLVFSTHQQLLLLRSNTSRFRGVGIEHRTGIDKFGFQSSTHPMITQDICVMWTVSNVMWVDHGPGRVCHIIESHRSFRSSILVAMAIIVSRIYLNESQQATAWAWHHLHFTMFSLWLFKSETQSNVGYGAHQHWLQTKKWKKNSKLPDSWNDETNENHNKTQMKQESKRPTNEKIVQKAHFNLNRNEIEMWKLNYGSTRHSLCQCVCMNWTIGKDQYRLEQSLGSSSS